MAPVSFPWGSPPGLGVRGSPCFQGVMVWQRLPGLPYRAPYRGATGPRGAGRLAVATSLCMARAKLPRAAPWGLGTTKEVLGTAKEVLGTTKEVLGTTKEVLGTTKEVLGTTRILENLLGFYQDFLAGFLPGFLPGVLRHS